MALDRRQFWRARHVCVFTSCLWNVVDASIRSILINAQINTFEFIGIKVLAQSMAWHCINMGMWCCVSTSRRCTICWATQPLIRYSVICRICRRGRCGTIWNNWVDKHVFENTKSCTTKSNRIVNLHQPNEALTIPCVWLCVCVWESIFAISSMGCLPWLLYFAYAHICKWETQCCITEAPTRQENDRPRVKWM